MGAGLSAATAKPKNMAEWMDAWIAVAQRDPVGGLYVSRFKDPIYFLLKPIAWVPNDDQKDKFTRVDVPIGFVTDFASIPRPFYSILRPDGDYSYAAVIHDYLYWTQARTRDEADEVFKFAMQDFAIDPSTIATIYHAVRIFGGRAWTENAKAKTLGEKRILAKMPDDPRITWEQWKMRPDVFQP